MRTWITAAALGAAVLGGFASAGVQAQAPSQPAPPAPPPSQAEDDGEGVVTRDDAAADADRRFAAMDANHDGEVSRDERRAWREQRRSPPPRDVHGEDGERRQAKRDADETQAQFRDRALRRFDRIDTNHDGRIDQRERDAMMLMMRARRAGHDMPPPDAGAPR